MNYNLLVVDDSQDVGRLLELILTRAGYHVVLAEDGREVMKLIQNQLPDLVLLDIMLPHMDGYEVCALIHQEYPNIPVLMLSSLDSQMAISRSLEVGACEHIPKPFDRTMLLAVVARHLEDNNEHE